VSLGVGDGGLESLGEGLGLGLGDADADADADGCGLVGLVLAGQLGDAVGAGLALGSQLGEADA
jgi:hypothetical protein